MLMVNQLGGFGGGGGGLQDELYQPAGTTRLLAIGFKDDATTFTTNSISGSIVGTLTRNTGPGPSGKPGFATGWSDDNRITMTSQNIYANARTFICWYKGTSVLLHTDRNSSLWNMGVPMFHDRSGGFMQFGLVGGYIATGSNPVTANDTDFVSDDTWHMLTWSTNGSSTQNMRAEVDGASVTGVTAGPKGSSYDIDGIGADFTGYTPRVFPATLAGIQIYSGQLTVTQVLEIYNAAF